MSDDMLTSRSMQLSARSPRQPPSESWDSLLPMTKEEFMERMEKEKEIAKSSKHSMIPVKQLDISGMSDGNAAQNLPTDFKDFMQKLVAAARKLSDLDAFCDHMLDDELVAIRNRQKSSPGAGESRSSPTPGPRHVRKIKKECTHMLTSNISATISTLIT
jgi:hypothetical protein